MRFLMYKDLKPLKNIPYSRTHLRRLCERGEFPKPQHLSERLTGWSEEVIDAWLRPRLGKAEAA